MDSEADRGHAAADPAAYRPAIDVLLASIPDLQAVYLFGSRAQGRTHAESDFDLAFLSPRPVPDGDRWELQEEVALRVHGDVDLIDLRSATTVMQMQVVSTAQVLYDGNSTERQFFEMRVLSAYALLNEERASILEDIRRRGRVYGG